MVGVVAPISGFIPNTPIVATLLPVLEGWCQRRGISPSKVLLPLSFATILGGTISLLGTSTNLLASDVSRQLGYGSLELFASFTAIGIPVWLIGSTYIFFFSDRQLPDRGSGEEDMLVSLAREELRRRRADPAGIELIGSSLHDSRLPRRFDVDVLELHRGPESFSAPLADLQLQAGDRLPLRCNRDNRPRLQQEQTVTLAPVGDQEDDLRELSGATESPQRVVEVAAERLHPGRGERPRPAVPPALQRHPAGGAPGQPGAAGAAAARRAAGPRRAAARGCPRCHPGDEGQQRPGGPRPTGEGLPTTDRKLTGIDHRGADDPAADVQAASR